MFLKNRCLLEVTKPHSFLHQELVQARGEATPLHPRYRTGRKSQAHPRLELSWFLSLGGRPQRRRVLSGCESLAECPVPHKECPPECRNFSCVTLSYGTLDNTSTSLAQQILKSNT